MTNHKDHYPPGQSGLEGGVKYLFNYKPTKITLLRVRSSRGDIRACLDDDLRFEVAAGRGSKINKGD